MTMLPRKQNRGTEDIRPMTDNLVWFLVDDNLDIIGRNLASLELGEHYVALLRSAYDIAGNDSLPNIIPVTHLELFKFIVETVFSGILADDFVLEDIATHAYNILDYPNADEANNVGVPYFSSYDFIYENGIVITNLIKYCIEIIMSRRIRNIYLTPLSWSDDIKTYTETLSLKLTFLEADRIYSDDWEEDERIANDLSE